MLKKYVQQANYLWLAKYHIVVFCVIRNVLRMQIDQPVYQIVDVFFEPTSTFMSSIFKSVEQFLIEGGYPMLKKYVKLSCPIIIAAVIILSFAPAQAFELQWFGQSAFKITTPGGKVVLIDPFITRDPSTPKEFKDLSKLGKIDLILVTHGHGDHVGDSAQLSKTSGAKVAMNADMGHSFAALGWVPYDRLIRFNKSGPIMPIGGHFTMDPAHAAYAVRNLLKVSRVIPMHYGTFPPLKGTPEQFKQQLAGFDAEVIVMQPGEKRNF
jgi:hypothetical protein